MNTKRVYFFPPTIYGSMQEFHQVSVWNYETNQWVKLTEISELIKRFSLIEPQETTEPPWGRGIIYAFISVHYPLHQSSVKSL